MATLLKEIKAASTHEGISVVLRLNGFEAAAERLSQLGSVVAENPDEPSFEIESVRALASFLVSEKQLPEPQIGVTPNGLVQIEWRVPTNGILAMEISDLRSHSVRGHLCPCPTWNRSFERPWHLAQGRHPESGFPVHEALVASMADTTLPDNHPVSRYCKPTTVDQYGLPLSAAFMS